MLSKWDSLIGSNDRIPILGFRQAQAIHSTAKIKKGSGSVLTNDYLYKVRN
ncbi:hypothetical protein ADIS_2890 [Lunatimonas lonarensis]|uniref:Uncharacterized protein n=1 Tax=Lunatimonas lonarensis TaxID=1232681 RepID=R7ZQP8_9BACT|nr:hypothetical protein ADIS_2890 [Lunatimonas lonarensis]